MRPQQKLLFIFYVKKYFCIKKLGRQKLMGLLINQVFFSFEMRKHASFAEMKLTPTVITKAQLLPFDHSSMRYVSLKFCKPYLLKNLEAATIDVL